MKMPFSRRIDSFSDGAAAAAAIAASAPACVRSFQVRPPSLQPAAAGRKGRVEQGGARQATCPATSSTGEGIGVWRILPACMACKKENGFVGSPTRRSAVHSRQYKCAPVLTHPYPSNPAAGWSFTLIRRSMRSRICPRPGTYTHRVARQVARQVARHGRSRARQVARQVTRHGRSRGRSRGTAGRARGRSHGRPVAGRAGPMGTAQYAWARRVPLRTAGPRAMP